MPVDDLAPKIKTKKGMANVPKLGMPVFDKPMTKAPNTYTRMDMGEDNKDKAASNIKCKNKKNIFLKGSSENNIDDCELPLHQKVSVCLEKIKSKNEQKGLWDLLKVKKKIISFTLTTDLE